MLVASEGEVAEEDEGVGDDVEVAKRAVRRTQGSLAAMSGAGGLVGIRVGQEDSLVYGESSMLVRAVRRVQATLVAMPGAGGLVSPPRSFSSNT